MLNKKFSPEKQSAFEARFEAQKIAFGPVVFQCVRYAWKHDILSTLSKAAEKGLSIDEMVLSGKWSSYTLKIILETCLSAGVVYLDNGKYILDKTGYCILTDRITQVNIDFVHNVCYQGLFDLDDALREQKPSGLKCLGKWETLYEGIPFLPDAARKSWLDFDHFYSDTSFPDILPDVFATNPHKILDIGANTGKFACAVLSANTAVEMHLMDLPQQLALAKQSVNLAGFSERVYFHPMNLLHDNTPFPGGMDMIWMSQFLSCFSEEVITDIMSRAVQALSENGQVLIMDTFWDRQKYDIASYCLINTSPYFTAIASGNSKVYECADYVRLCEKTGLKLLSIRDNIGFCHSLLRFAKKSSE